MIFCDMRRLPTGNWKCAKCLRIIRVRGITKPPKRECKEATPRIGPCQSIGDELRREVCGTCGGNQYKLKVFACAFHGECTLEKQLPEVKCCRSCADFEAIRLAEASSL